MKRLVLSLLGAGLLGFGAAAASATVAFEYCGDPEYEADVYLRPVGAFDVYVVSAPACSLEARQLAKVKVPSYGWLECLVLLGFAAGLGVAAARFRTAPAPLAVLALLATICAGLGGENLTRILLVRGALADGHGAVQRGAPGDALAAVSSARRRQQAAWLPRIAFWDVAIEQLELGALQESAGICAVADALGRGETTDAVRFLTDFPIRTDAGREAHLAALTHDTQALLAAEETAAPVRRSVRALTLQPDFEPLHGNLSIARYHHTEALVRAGDAQAGLDLAKELEAPGSAIPLQDREAMRGYAARAVARERLGDPQTADTQTAVAVLEDAHAYALDHGRTFVFIDCDLAAALEADALLKLVRKQPGAAVEALDRSDRLVPERDVVKELRPQALLAHGSQLLQGRRFEPAIHSLRRAFDETGGKDDTIRQTLGLAWYSSGGDAHEQGRLDEAITAYQEAVAVIPTDENVRFSLGEALTDRADTAFKAGRVTPAADDLEQAAKYSPTHRPAARERLRYVPGMAERIAAIRTSAGFIQAPQVAGELPRDLDGDGRVDHAVYYGPDHGTPVAVAPPKRGARPPAELAITSRSPAGGAAVAVLRDLDRDGSFDERIEYRGGNLSDLWTDVDGDSMPDVRGIEFNRDAFEFNQQSLSGRVMMHVKGGVIAAAQDFFSDPDAYLILRKNWAYVGSTSTSLNTYYPTWHQGIVLDYQYGDRVRLELWDEDLFDDDLIDVYETTQLPATGIYQFAGRKAAVEIDVTPARLPEGHHVEFDAPLVSSNVFRENPTAVPEVADIVAGARGAEATTRAVQWVTKAAVVHVLLPRLLPGATGWQRFAAELVVEHAVLNPAMGLD